jgi:hypothetical protein
MAIARRAADLDAILAKLGVPLALTGPGVSGGVQNSVGKFRRAGETVDAGDGPSTYQGSQASVLIRTGTLPSLDVGQVLKIDGVNHVVVDHFPEDDGQLTRIIVAQP